MTSNEKLTVMFLVLLTLALVASSDTIKGLLTESVTLPNQGVVGAVEDGMELHADGRWIKDSLGRTVHLRGVNKGGYNNYQTGRWQAEGEMSYGGQLEFRESAVHFQMNHLRNVWGINCMRWTLCCEWWVNDLNNYRYNIRRAVEIAQEYGIYIILAPWRVTDAIGYVRDPFIDWTPQQLVDFWLSVMSELGHCPNIIIDPFNEPLSDTTTWQNFMQQLINAIRGAGYEHIILYQWGYGAGPNRRLVDWFDQYPITDPSENLVISTHTYGNAEGYAWTNQDDYTSLKAQLETAQYKDVGDVLNMPLLIGETGGRDGEQQFFSNLLQIFNEWGIGYIPWILFPGGGYPLIENELYFPPPTWRGQTLIDAISAGSP